MFGIQTWEKFISWTRKAPGSKAAALILTQVKSALPPGVSMLAHKLIRSPMLAAAFSVVLFVLVPAALAQQASAPPQTDTATIDPDGTAHVTRVVPVPGTISPEAQKFISRPGPSGPEETLTERRTHTDTFRVGRAAEARKLYPVNVEEKTIGGVRCDVITPLTVDAKKRNRVLINVHGGGFNSDSGSLIEGVPIASLTHTKVVSVYYRLAPEHPFPAAVDDTVAVYKELLKTHKPKNIGLFGTSAGAILTGEVASRLRRDGIPLPGALGIFSGFGDFSQAGDSQALYTIWGLGGHLEPPTKGTHDPEYVGSTDPKDPVLSPLYADLHGFPPTLFVTSERDLLLSGTTILHRAFLRAGVDAQLVVFEALPHAFWYDFQLPETKEALGIMARFFDEKLSGTKLNAGAGGGLD
jgi:epsilon-lactone hydrolase